MPKVTRRAFVTTVSAASVVPATAMMSTPASAEAARAAHDATPPKTDLFVFQCRRSAFHRSGVRTADSRR